MYADLLTRALGDDGERRRSEDRLRADLVRSRARLAAADGETPVADVLARELSYDGALIRLCRALDVPTGVPRFAAHPAVERARLEGELARRGVG